MIASRQCPPAQTGLSPDGLLCAVFLDPNRVSRNRLFPVYAEPKARRAHARAHALRRSLGQVLHTLAAGQNVVAVEQNEGIEIVLREEALSLVRTMHLGPLDASLFRLLLQAKADDVAGLPSCLRETASDRTRVEASLSKVVGPLQLPQASMWLAKLDARRGDRVAQDGTAGTE